MHQKASVDAPRGLSDFVEGYCQATVKSTDWHPSLQGPRHQKAGVGRLNDFVEGYCQATVKSTDRHLSLQGPRH